MDIFETLKLRHSIRRFTDNAVNDRQIEQVLRSALMSPSSKNCHSTSFFVVKERETIAKLALMRESGSAFLTGAPVAIVVCGDPSLSDLWVDNAAISATVIQLASVALGLGSCWVHVNGRLRNSSSDETASDYLRTVVPIPENLNPLCVIAIGYPVEGQKVVPHADLYDEKVVWI